MTATMLMCLMCLLIGNFAGMIAGEIRVNTFWGGFAVSGIALLVAIAASSPIWLYAGTP